MSRVLIGNREGEPLFQLCLYGTDRLNVSRWKLSRIIARRGEDPTHYTWVCGDMIIPLPRTPHERSPTH